jgi:hypothetical protein
VGFGQRAGLFEHGRKFYLNSAHDLQNLTGNLDSFLLLSPLIIIIIIIIIIIDYYYVVFVLVMSKM